MGFFDRKSSTNTTTNQYGTEVGVQDGVAVVGDGARYLQTDHGAIAAGLQFAGQAGNAAFTFAGESGAAAYDLARQAGFEALAFAGQAGDASYGFAAGAGDAAFRFGDAANQSAYGFAGASGHAAFQFAGEAGQAALDYGDAALLFAGEAGANYSTAMNRALTEVANFGVTALETQAQTNREALFAVDRSQDRAYAFSAGAVEAAFGAAETAQNSVDAMARTTVDTVASAYGDASQVSQIAFLTALDSADSSAAAMQASFVEATGAIERANTSEDGKISQQMMYLAAGLVGLLVIRTLK